MRSLSRPLSRRTVQGILAGAALVPLTGCDLLPESTPAGPPGPTADERLVDRVTTEIRRARDVATAAPGGRSLVEVHDAHLAALGAPTPSRSTPATPTPGAPAAGSADLRSAERALESALTDAATRAGDGGLARLLASMAASVAQHAAAPLAGKVAR